MTLTGLEVSQTWRFEIKHRNVFVYLQTRRSHDMCVCFDLQSPSCTLSVRPLWRLYASLCVSSLTQTLNLQLHHCWIGDVGVSPSASRSQSPTLMCGQIINSLFSSFSFSLSTPCSLFLWQVTWTCRPGVSTDGLKGFKVSELAGWVTWSNCGQCSCLTTKVC